MGRQLKLPDEAPGIGKIRIERHCLAHIDQRLGLIASCLRDEAESVPRPGILRAALNSQPASRLGFSEVALFPVSETELQFLLAAISLSGQVHIRRALPG
jgi:hypothetical protein